MKKPINILMLIVISLFLILFAFFSGYLNVIAVGIKLLKIPNVRILNIKPGTSSNFAIASINIRGEMIFSGWSLIPEQFDNNNTKSIGLSQIGICKVIVITDTSYREWIALDQEINPKINTVEKAIKNYDYILNKIKSFPSYSKNIKKGFYSICN